MPVEGGSSQADVHGNFHILHPEAGHLRASFASFIQPQESPRRFEAPLLPFLVQQNQKEQRKTISRDWTH